MIKRLWHLIRGHCSTEERVYLPPSYPDRPLLMHEQDYYERYGFTMILHSCECGAIKKTKVVGDFGAGGRPDSDLIELKRMARL